MKVTNKFNLPKSVYEALTKDTYDLSNPPEDIISATTLIGPPRIRQLTIRHWDELSEDASERFWTFMGCYDKKTEVFTGEGWKFFKDVDIKKDKFLNFSTEKKEIQWQKATNKFCYDYSGPMYRIKNRSLDLLLTPNHNMVYVGEDKKRIYLEKIEKMKGRKNIPKGIKNWKGNKVDKFILPEIKYIGKKKIREKIEIDMNLWLKFLGIWLAEGCVDKCRNGSGNYAYRITICQTKQHVRDEIETLLNSLPFSFNKRENRFVISNKQLYMYLKQFGKCYDKFIPKKIKDLSKEQLKILMEWLIKGDGHIYDGDRVGYYTTSRRLRDDVCEIFIKLGYMISIFKSSNESSIINDRIVKSTVPCYEVRTLLSKSFILRPGKVSKEKYRGKVYCVETPNNTLLVKRNDKISWCGNSCAHEALALVSKEKRIIEERVNIKVHGIIVSGKPDIYDEIVKSIEDYKFTKVYAVKKLKKEWIEQLNVYAWLLRKTGKEILKLFINALLKDQNNRTFMLTGGDYPAIPFKQMEVPLWDFEKQEAYIAERIKLHQAAACLPDEELPPCTREERWQKPDRFAVMKNKNKRAVRVFDAEQEAKDLIIANENGKVDFRVEKREGESIRCGKYPRGYCIVSPHCNLCQER